MEVISDPAQIRKTLTKHLANDQRIGLIPTMGALHDGHLSLVDASKKTCDFHVVTIFLNPTQFGEGEDLSKYPRTLESDLALLEQRGANFVFTPTTETMYPDGYSTFVEPPEIATSLEGERRPGHFKGVCTVVAKLFNLCPATDAFFGEKDFQQCAVIEKMCIDINFGIKIHRCPIVREFDGLAMSSRNQYLDGLERERALGLSRSLNLAEQLVQEGVSDSAEIEEQMRQSLMDSRVDKIDYVAIVDATTLDPVNEITDNSVALIAAYIGTTRLIDNRRIAEKVG